MKSIIALASAFLLFPLISYSQAYEKRKVSAKELTVCYAKETEEHTYVAPPRAFREARTQSAVFEVTYIGFSDEAKNAFQAAVDIWSTLITSDVPIRITAQWTPLASGVLGSASAGTFIRNFSGAQRQQTWYPVALAEKIMGVDLNEDDPDIVASFNSNYSSWFYGTSGGATTGTYDLVSIVLHEIGHGLGINHNYSVSTTSAQTSGGDFVFTYSTFLENNAASPQNIVSSFSQPSATLRTQLTSGSLFFNSPSVLSVNGNTRARIYAPATFSAGSSIAHLDETTYPAGHSNSLMTPQIGFTEVIHDPGPVAMAILNDLGWVSTSVRHTALPNTETLNAPYVVTGAIDSDVAYDAASVELHYTTNGTTYTHVPMTATGNADEFSGNIPASVNPITYGYYITVKDNTQKQSSLPGMQYLQGSTPRQSYFVFSAGPDTQAPRIVHDAKQFLVDTDTQLVISATISDNIDIQAAGVEYLINDVPQPGLPMLMIDSADSLYEATINFSPLLSQGDVVKYRIIARDTARGGQNYAYAPSATTYYELPVTGLLPVQDSYTNNFNSATTDFFGDNLFSVQTPSGFSNGAIHTSHPYPNGTGANSESNFVYQLKVPVKLKASDSYVRFDEIVLVEPSDAGAVFGGEGFYDYVIVEGSKDGGTTWKQLADGYNANSQPVWLTRFESAKDNEAQPNSTATGDPALFIGREINLLAEGNFAAGDEVVIRFRLHTDQLVHGWGWAIDNLRIQIDDTPPQLLHDHLNYQLAGNDQFVISVNTTDADAVSSLSIEYQVNNDAIGTFDFPVVAGTSDYSLTQTVTGIGKGDVFKYRIRSKDPSGNEAVLPAADFFNVPVIEFNAPASQYVSDFNSANADFVGNFFAVSQPSGFSNGLINTTHPYPNGFGSDKTSSFIYVLKTPIVISATNPYIRLDEVTLVEPSTTEYVAIECSKDNGTTWEAILNTYNASANVAWNSAFVAAQSGSASLLKTRLVSMTSNGKFKAGDQVLVRFRMNVNAAVNGWGWGIDNLSIQGTITGLEPSSLADVQVYPNPVENSRVTVQLSAEQPASFQVAFFNAQGKLMAAEKVEVQNAIEQKEFDTAWPAGLYILRVKSGDKTVSRKIIVH